MAKDFHIRFWGVRGSFPKAGPGTIRFGGNTSSLEVRAGGHLIVLDAGTGIINLGDALVREWIESNKDPMKRTAVNATIFLTHLHHDHIQGIPFFKPAFMPMSTLRILGPTTLEIPVEQTLRELMAPHVFPVQWGNLASQRAVRDIRETEVIVFKPDVAEPEYRDPFRGGGAPVPPEAVKITMMRSYGHPHDGVLVFKIQHKGKTLVYATDTEGYVGGDRKLIQFSKDADFLIHDAQYRPGEYEGMPSVQGFGHSTPDMAAYVAKEAGVKRLALFHYDPRHDDATIDDQLKLAQKVFPTTVATAEGLELDL